MHVTPHESHLNSDGTVFPPVTPDPPVPPGQEDISVPDILPVRAADGQDGSDRSDSPGAPVGPDAVEAAADADGLPSPESEGPTS
jgi:hypothetical protein